MAKEKELILSSLLLAVFIFMPITRVLPTFAKALLVFLSILFLILNECRRRKLGRVLLFIACAIVVDLLIYYGVWRNNTSVEFFSKNLMLFVFWYPFLLMDPLIHASKATKRIIIRIAFALALIEVVCTIVGNLIFDYPSRTLASTANLELNRKYQLMNIGGYGFIFSLVMVLPYLIYCLRTGKKKIWFVLLLALVELCIVLSNYMSAILLSLFAVVLSLVVGVKNLRLSFVMVGLMAILFLLLRPVIADFSYELYERNISNNPIIALRFLDLHDFLTFGKVGGDLGYRTQLRNNSISAFLSSPLFGNLLFGYRELGLHSEFFDLLGGIGLFGFLLLIAASILNCGHGFRSIYNDSSIKRYFVVSVALILAFSLIDVVTTAPEVSCSIVFAFSLSCNASVDLMESGVTCRALGRVRAL